MTDDFDTKDREAPFPEEGAAELRGIEVKFAIPVKMTQEQQKRLLSLISEVIGRPWNLPKNGLHWVSSMGSKVKWSRIDALLLGEVPAHDAPRIGDPENDDGVLCITSTARPFNDNKERVQTLFNRSSPGLCVDCREPQFMTRGGLSCKNGHGGAPTISRETGEVIAVVYPDWPETPRPRDDFED